MKRNKVLTKRWTRSPNGEIFGVATGLAEWKDLPPEITRLFIFLIICFTGFFPGLVAYLLLALILPVQRESDIIYERGRGGDSHYYRTSKAEDASFHSEKSDEELRREYEELKRKVETMESDMFNKERDWDSRFKEEKE